MRFMTNITKEYPHMIRVLVFKEPKPIILPENTIKRDKVQVDDEHYVPSITSLKRTKTTIRDLILCNEFELFATFTFDPKKISSRFSYSACYTKFSTWVHHQLATSPDLKYLAIPEQHKNGAWHFHVLMSNYRGTIKDSHHQTSSGYPIYNITSYRSGFSTATYIDNPDIVARYVMKYITKDFIRRFNQRRFTCSRNLIRPTRTVNAIVDFTLPHFTVFDDGDVELVEFPIE